MRWLLVVVVSVALVSVPAGGTTFGTPFDGHCPQCDHRLSVRPVKSRFQPRMDRAVSRIRPRPVTVCPRCGFVGRSTDFRGGARHGAFVRLLVAARLRAPRGNDPLRVSADLASVRGLSALEVGQRYLEAAAVADDPADRRALRRAARDALVASPSPAASVAYAIGELSRQLGDRALARTWLGRAAGAAGTPAHLRGWAVAALARLGR